MPMLYFSANLPVLDFTTLLSNLKLLCWVQISCLNPVSPDQWWAVWKWFKSLCLFLQLLSRILSFLMPFVTTIFCGHIGNAELAGYALASAVLSLLLCRLISFTCCKLYNYYHYSFTASTSLYYLYCCSLLSCYEFSLLLTIRINICVCVLWWWSLMLILCTFKHQRGLSKAVVQPASQTETI